MSTLSTNDVIEYCLIHNFKNNTIKNINIEKNLPIGPMEALIEIKDKHIRIIDKHIIQDDLRFNFVYQIINYILEKTNLSLNCKFILNCDDGISEKEKYTRLCFSTNEESNHIQIPDPHIFNYENFKDCLEKDDKSDRAIFFGSDTGPLNNKLTNERIDFCFAAKDNEKVFAKITNFVFFTDEMLSKIGLDINNIKHDFVSIEDQLKNKYIINICGNTASWDRIPWAMASNSYLIDLKSKCNEYNWYFPIIKKMNALESLSSEDILNFNFRFDEDKKTLQKNIGSIIIKQNTHIQYFANLLLKYNIIYNS